MEEEWGSWLLGVFGEEEKGKNKIKIKMGVGSFGKIGGEKQKKKKNGE